MSLSLPDNYLVYNVSFTRVDIATADLDYIFKWKQATRIIIHDQSDFGYRFSQRSEELKGLKNLESFSFDLQQKSYKQLNIKDILYGPPALKSVTAFRSLLTAQEYKEFIKNQHLILKWSFVNFYDRVWYFKDIV